MSNAHDFKNFFFVSRQAMSLIGDSLIKEIYTPGLMQILNEAVVKKELQDPSAALQEKQQSTADMEQNSAGLNNDTNITQQTEDGGADYAAGYPGPNLVEIYPMRYHHFHVKIYKQLSTPPRFYYEPILLLDPLKTVSKFDKATEQHYVRFTIQMWDQKVEEQVVNWIKRLPGSQDVEDFCVQTMPFEKVRLVFRDIPSTSKSYRLPEQWRTYQHLPQNIQFHLLCETKEAANTVVESFRADPEFSMQNLALQCIFSADPSIQPSANSSHHRKRPRIEGGGPFSDIAGYSTVLSFNIDHVIDSFDENLVHGITE